jgi:hypothetical protein
MTPLAATRWRQEGHAAAPGPGLAPLTRYLGSPALPILLANSLGPSGTGDSASLGSSSCPGAG